jgi:hypothetical protein
MLDMTPPWKPASRHHLGEQRMQPADGAVPEGDQVPAAVQEQPERLGEVLELDLA